MLTVSQLFIYPIKSLGGIQVSSASVTDRGFQYDRRWMLVDADNKFLTQRTFAEMATLQVGIAEEGLTITCKTTGDILAVSFQPETNETAIAQIWDDHCQVQFVSKQADTWFSAKLEMKCRLVYMPDEAQRRVDEAYSKNDDLTSLSDDFPFLIIGQSSLDDLNSRLQQTIAMDRFRPNIVFTGGTPFQEDEMHHFTINNIQFYGVKPCARCVVTTINQQTAIKGKEPLVTLATYRRSGNKTLFGQNLLSKGVGVVTVGDPISILSRG